MDANGDGQDDGHGHDAGLGGHHSAHDAYGNVDHAGPGQATWDALSVGYSHGSGHEYNGFGMVAGGSHCGGAHGGVAHQAHTHAGPQSQTVVLHDDRCDVPPARQVNDERRIYVAHVIGHGDVEMTWALNRIAAKYDVIRLDTFRPSVNGEDRLEKELADDEPWLPPYNVLATPPGGWYPGATGTTRLVKQVWQVGKRPSLFQKGLVYALRKMRKHDWVTKPEYDNKAKTTFEVGIVTWNYRETGDHDTLITIRIVSTKVWQPYLGLYGYKKEPFLKHQHAAEHIIAELLEELKKAVPTTEQRQRRLIRTNAAMQIPPEPACPPVPEGEVAPSGTDLGSVVNEPPIVSLGPDLEPAPLKKVDVVVSIPR